MKTHSNARVAAGWLTLLALVLTPTVSDASPNTLRRAFGDLLQAPLDIALGPVVAGVNLVRNMREIDDPIPVRIIFAGPGYIWLTGLQVGAGVLRGIAGAFELLPGIAVFALRADLDPLMAPVDRAPGLVEIDNPLEYVENPYVRYNPLLTPFSFHVKFGLNYTTSE